MATSGAHRRGALLIVVVGLVAILFALGAGFLMRMRSDTEDAREIGREVQARAMLSAGLMYLQESSRLGWDRWDDLIAAGVTPTGHDEAYGWIDVRDGEAGPRDRSGMPLAPASTGFPAIGPPAARFPMHVWTRPPWAIRLDAAFNPIPNQPADMARPWAELISYNVGANAGDPRPVASSWADFKRGDRQPTMQSAGMSWFRVLRTGKATFQIACGAGATQGFIDFADADAQGQGGTFGSRQAFDELRRGETILFFACEWTPSVGYAGGLTQTPGQYDLLPTGDPADYRPRQNSRQFLGSFLWIEKLQGQPAVW